VGKDFRKLENGGERYYHCMGKRVETSCPRYQIALGDAAVNYCVIFPY